MVTKAKSVTQVNDEETAFDLEGWVKQGIKGLQRSVKCEAPRILPEQFRAHTRAARKEMLLAVRSLLDSAIQELDRTSDPEAR